MNAYQTAVGARIREVRRSRGLTTRQLADLMPQPCGEGAVSAWERGHRAMNLDRLAAVAAVLDIPITELLPEPASLTSTQENAMTITPAPSRYALVAPHLGHERALAVATELGDKPVSISAMAAALRASEPLFHVQVAPGVRLTDQPVGYDEALGRIFEMHGDLGVGELRWTSPFAAETVEEDGGVVFYEIITA